VSQRKILGSTRGASAAGGIRRGERVGDSALAIACFLVKMDFMPDERSVIPLADVLRAANELVSAGLIEDYALGGALAAIYYTEPVATYDAHIIFIASDKTLTAGILAIYSHLQSKGWRVDREHLLLKDFPVQFLAASGLTEEAVRNAKQIQFEGTPARVFSPEYSSLLLRALADTKISRALSRCLIRSRLTDRCWTTFCTGII
jgi:hypothetical protein